MKASEIRSSFLKYFEKNGHTVVESSPLVPGNDPTLLFTNAGMVQFKDVFTGQEKRPYSRATTAQKCVRAGGKHNDLENVGFTARHHTFFEMLGNFSFGDYFKKEAIRFAWEYVTKELSLPKDRLYVTVHLDDDEAAEIWHRQEKVPKNRISRFDEDNFWAMGETGPCGPCTEIFIDRGEKYGCKKKNCAVGCDCDRYTEFWNLVFMQFERDPSGKLTPLPKPSVDTGAGLERIASILQQVDSNYEIDSFQEILNQTSELAKKKYNPKDSSAFPFRVIADHSRASAFLIGDGVLPSNEGRGYVLRRIIRRAIRYGRQLDLNDPFLHQTAGFVIDQMKSAYPDLEGKRSFIQKAIRAEEEQFLRTLERGLSLLDEEIRGLKSKTLPGEIAFKLYDTYGFPVDLTRLICQEKGIGVDEKGFEKSMDHQKSESRKHWKGSGEEKISAVYQEVASQLREKNKLPEFLGYTQTESESECVAILAQKDGAWKTVDQSPEGEAFQAIFLKTPFYGESGGQVGDQGRVHTGNFEATVTDVQKPVDGLIVAQLKPKKGILKTGQAVKQEVAQEIRSLTARNHTATHLLHWALHQVLGDHVKQAGSLVAPHLLRFDFTHFQPVTQDELLKIEDLVNQSIWNLSPVSKKEMSKDEAIQAGAIAFFGEKYGDRVRVVEVGDFSMELCGGTHVDNAGEIHFFKIVSEGGIAAGVRRMVAYTSKGAFDYLRERDQELGEVRQQLRATNSKETLEKISRLHQNEKKLKKEIEGLQAKMAGGEVDEILGNAQQLKKGVLISQLCLADPGGIKKLRELSDRLRQKEANSAIVLGMADPDGKKAMLLASVAKKLSKEIGANQIIQEIAPLIDGRGGGKPELAQAGGTRVSELQTALERAKSILTEKLS